MAEKTIITSLFWVKRGYAKVVTDTYEPTEEEIEEVKKLSQKFSSK
jgi:hypothetical protein